MFLSELILLQMYGSCVPLLTNFKIRCWSDVVSLLMTNINTRVSIIGQSSRSYRLRFNKSQNAIYKFGNCYELISHLENPPNAPKVLTYKRHSNFYSHSYPLFLLHPVLGFVIVDSSELQYLVIRLFHYIIHVCFVPVATSSFRV